MLSICARRQGHRLVASYGLLLVQHGMHDQEGQEGTGRPNRRSSIITSQKSENNKHKPEREEELVGLVWIVVFRAPMPRKHTWQPLTTSSPRGLCLFIALIENENTSFFFRTPFVFIVQKSQGAQGKVVYPFLIHHHCDLALPCWDTILSRNRFDFLSSPPQ